MSPVTAPAQVQWRLLDVQGFDTRLGQLAHRTRTLPERAAVDALTARIRAVTDELVGARTVSSDIERERSKAEADVEQVRVRAARDSARLNSGAGTPKDLTALSHEVQLLARRQSVLEDVELEVMERLETAEEAVSALLARQAGIQDELTAAEADLRLRLGEIEDEGRSVARQREDAVAGVPGELLALYEKIRADHGNVGAARVYQRRCEGCRIELNNVDINRIRAAADDEVLRCEECSRILVRTLESGL